MDSPRTSPILMEEEDFSTAEISQGTVNNCKHCSGIPREYACKLKNRIKSLETRLEEAYAFIKSLRKKSPLNSDPRKLRDSVTNKSHLQ